MRVGIIPPIAGQSLRQAQSPSVAHSPAAPFADHTLLDRAYQGPHDGCSVGQCQRATEVPDRFQVLTNAARLADEAADALRRGDSEAAYRLQREAESAWWRAPRLGQRQASPVPGADQDTERLRASRNRPN